MDKKTRKEVRSTQKFPEKEGSCKKGSYRQINMNRTVGNRMCEYQNGCHYGKCRIWVQALEDLLGISSKNLAKNKHWYIIFRCSQQLFFCIFADSA